MPNLKYDIYNSQINPQTGTPEYFNINKQNKAPIVDWSEYRRTKAATSPINEGVGLEFVPYGGIKDIDERLTSYDIKTDIPEARAQAQIGLGLTGKFLGQLGSEALLGIPEAVGYALDFEEIYNSEAQSRDGFDNAFSRFFRNAKEYIQDEWIPIYQSREATEGDFMDRLTDPTWVASQGKTIGTTLSLMAPAIAIGLATEGTGAPMIGAMASAMFSRKAESAMEANGVFRQEYQKYINEGKDDETARRLAGQIAATTFKGNAAMLPLDFMQYATFMKPFAGFAKTLEAAKATNIGRAAGLGLNIISEGAEEGYQNIVQNEAIKQTRDGIDAFGSGFGDRLGDYIKDPEFQTSVFMGGVTGGIFDVFGHVSNKIKDKIEENSVKKLIAANLGDVDTFNKIDNKVEGDMLARAINTNQIGNLKSSISAFINDIDASDKYDNDTKAEMKSKASKLLENAEYIENADSELKKLKPEYNINPHVRRQYVLDKYEDKKNSETIDQARRKLSESISSANFGADAVTSLKNNAVIAKAKIESYKNILGKLESDRKLDKNTKEEKIKFVNKAIEDLTKDMDNNIASATIQDPSFNLSKYSLPNINEIKLRSLFLNQLELKRDIIRQRLAEFENKTPDQLSKDEEKIVKEKVDNLNNIQREVITDEIDAAETPEQVASVTSKVDEISLPKAEKEGLKSKIIENHNAKTTRTDQTEKNAEPIPRKFNESIKFKTEQQEYSSQLTGDNQMDEALSTPEAVDIIGDQFSIEPIVIRNTPENIRPAVANTPTKILNEEVKTDEVIPVEEETFIDSIKVEEKEIYNEQFALVATTVSVAHKTTQSIDGEDTYVDGKLVLTKGTNENIFDPEFANKGTELLFSIDTEFVSEEFPHLSYANAKDKLDLVPIKITTKDGEQVGYVHTIEWIESKENLDRQTKDRLIKAHRETRQFFFDNGVLNISKVGQSFSENKSVGWVNLNPLVKVGDKLVREFKSIDTAFKHDGVWDDNVEMLTLTGDDAGNINTVNDKSFMSLKGKTVTLIPGSNGQVVTKVLKQKTFAKAPKEIQDEFIHNILGIIYHATYNDVSRDDLYNEVGKYLHATVKNNVDVDRLAYSNKLDLLFNLDLFEGAQKNVTISIRKPNTQLYDVYKVSRVNGRINISKRVNVKTNEFKDVSPKEFESILKEALSKKYLNLSKKSLANPKEFTRLIADAGYNVTRTKVGDYRDFISYTGAASTSVHGITLSNGKVTYTTQPTISYNPKLNWAQQEAKSTEEITAPVEPTTPAQAKARKSRLTPKGKVAKLESDDIQTLGNSELELSKSTISSFSLIPSVVQENDLVSTMVNLYLAEYSKSTAPSESKEDAVFDAILDEIKAMNEDATDGVFYEDDEAANAQVQKYTKLIIDNFEPSYNDDGTVKFIGYKTKIKIELERLKFDPMENSDEEYSDSDTTQAQFVDNKTFKEDPEKSASSRIKRGLASIPLYENDQLKTNLIGLEVYRDYYQVFSTLMEATSDVNINEIQDEISSLAQDISKTHGQNNIYAQVNDILNKSFADNTDTFYNEFMKVFKKQRTKFIRPIIYNKSVEDSQTKQRVDLLPTISLYNSNKSGAAGVLFNKWSEGVKSSPLVAKIKSELAKNRSSKTHEALMKRFVDARNITDYEEHYNEISNIFTELGFEISVDALKRLSFTLSNSPARLSDLEVFDRGAKLTFNSFIFRNFRYLIESFGKYDNLLESENEDSDGVDNDIFKSQAKYIAALARFETKVNPSVLSSSFRNGNGDVIYGFVNPHHLSNTINDIKTSEAKRRNMLLDAFSQFATWLSPEGISELELLYLDSATNGDSKKMSVSFEDMSTIEKEQVKAALVFNKGGKKGYFMTPTPSDKTTFAVISAIREELDKDKHLDLIDGKNVKLKESGELIDRLYKLFVESEIYRIQSTVSLVKEAISNKDFSKLIKGEHYDIKDGKVVLGTRGFFFLIPQMNEFFKDRLSNALTSDHFVVGDGEILSNGEFINVAAKRFLAEELNKLHELKSSQWSAIGMYNRLDRHYKDKVVKMVPQAYFESFATMDYLVNSMVAYANQFMLITGDPATFAVTKKWDGTVDNWKTLVDDTVTNMFKRVAKDIAPGYEGLYEANEQEYNVLFINEPKRSSKLIEEYEGSLNVKGVFTDIEFADAQEWTTLEEHVRVLAANGIISKAKKENIINEYRSTKTLSEDNLKLVMQPMKPVQVGRKIVDGVSTEYYIKTSSFPLIPQLTMGLDIDKVREFMEENKIDRLVPKSAVKLGFSKAISITDGNGNILTSEDGKLAPKGFKIAEEGKLSESLHTLDRSYFRIQQDVPYDEAKAKILEGSQLKKLKYSDLLAIWDFDLYGSPKKGYELKQLDDDIHSELYKRSYESLVEKLNGAKLRDGLGELKDLGKLKELLIDEAKQRGFDYNDLMLLNTMIDNPGFDKTPLFMHPALPKIEALLNSLIKNKVLVTKFPGKSYVQGSSMGFDFIVSGDRNVIKEIGNKTGVKFLNSFEWELKYKIEDNKVVAQVLMPWFFKESMSNFIDKNTGILDESKIDKELLELIGYRIPTQDHGSMVKLQVVGFLPKTSGDLLIVPPELSKIMGSDFDVDKLYVHRFNYDFDSGFLTKIKPKSIVPSELTIEELQNLSMDITMSILSNKEIAERLVSPLDNNDVDNVLKSIDKLKESSTKKSNKIDVSKASNTSPLFDSLHSIFVDINAAGKTGIGIGSIASTSHVLAQYSGIYIKQYTISEKLGIFFDSAIKFTDKKDNRLNGIAFKEVDSDVKQDSANIGFGYDDHVTNGLYRLDRIYGLGGKRISQVIKNIQTEAVDNAKNQRLFGMNLNKNTFDTALLLAKAGLDEKYIGYFLNQPIIVDYVNALNNMSDIGSTEFEAGKKDKIKLATWKKWAKTDMPENLQSKIVSLEDMTDALSGNVDNKVQLDILESFIVYAEIAEKLSAMFRAINTDTKYLGKSLTSTIAKQTDFEKYFNEVKAFGNVDNLRKTLQLSAHKYGIEGSMSLFSGLLPYDSDFFRALRARYELIIGRELTETNLDDLFASVKNSMWTESWRQYLDIDDIDAERVRLLFGNDNIPALAKRLAEAKKTSKNTLVKFLDVKTSSIKGIPDVIEFPSAGALEKDFSLKMQQSWLQLYRTNRELALDLVSYCMVNGNQRSARDFSRFIPIDILSDLGVIKIMSSVFNNVVSDVNGEYADNMIKQYIQHNPRMAKAEDIDNFNTYTADGKTTENISKADILIPQMESEDQYVYIYDKTAYKNHLYEFVDGKYIRIPILGHSKSLMTEYNLVKPDKDSIFAPTKKKDSKVKVETSIPTKSTEGQSDIAATFGYTNGAKVSTVLDNILNNGPRSNMNNEGLLELVKLLKDNHSELLDTVELQVATKDNPMLKGRWGEFNPKPNTIKINFANIVAMPKGNEWGFPQSTAEEFFVLTLTHELFHKITKNRTKSKELYRLFDVFKSEFSGNTAMTKYMKDIDEFLSGLFTDKNMQAKLNSVIVDGKSLASRIWNEIKRIISGDINIKEGSLLDLSMQEAFKLIAPEQKPSAQEGLDIGDALGDIQALMDYSFNESDLKEAEKVQKYCNTKTGKIKK